MCWASLIDQHILEPATEFTFQVQCPSQSRGQNQVLRELMERQYGSLGLPANTHSCTAHSLALRPAITTAHVPRANCAAENTLLTSLWSSDAAAISRENMTIVMEHFVCGHFTEF